MTGQEEQKSSLADINQRTMNIDGHQMEKKISDE
jgi:hypothetical protein